MEPKDFRRDLIQKSPDEIVEYISENRDAIRHMFLSNQLRDEDIDNFEEVLYVIVSKDFPIEQIESESLQSLFVFLAYFFKRAKKYDFIDTCYNQISNVYFKKRLDAWIKAKRYHTFDEHVRGYESYLEILTSASEQSDDGNCNEVLQDLKEYHEYIHENLSPKFLEKINNLIQNEDLQQKYPLLAQFLRHESDEISNLDVQSYDQEELSPSDLSNSVFNDCFLNRIRLRSGIDFPDKLFGYHHGKIRYDIIRQGQADFDLKYANLTPDDITDLYCYFNMRMHYYSSLSLYQRSNIMERYYNNSGKIKFIDIGCGPATCGLAFTDYIHKKTNENVVFDYFGIDSARSMREKGQQIMTNDVFEKTNQLLFYDEILQIDLSVLENATCIIINCCFVFASETLPIEDIARYINNLIDKYPYTPKYLLYQNSVKQELNESFEEFKKMIPSITELSIQETIKYHNVQNPYYPPKQVTGKFELLKIQ